jgi:hypothetical protein
LRKYSESVFAQIKYNYDEDFRIRSGAGDLLAPLLILTTKTSAPIQRSYRTIAFPRLRSLPDNTLRRLEVFWTSIKL